MTITMYTYTNDYMLNIFYKKTPQFTKIQGGPKNLTPFFLYALTLPNINRFSKLFHC